MSCALIVVAESGLSTSQNNEVEFEHAVEIRKIWWEPNDTEMPPRLISNHAIAVAQQEIASGNLDVSIDQDEEQDRLTRARWVSIPDEMAGTFDNYSSKPGARLKIAPHPRFENWVKMLKKLLIKDTEPSKKDADA